MAQPLQQMGAEAVRLLLALLGGDANEEHIQFPASLVVRGSTAPLRPHR